MLLIIQWVCPGLAASWLSGSGSRRCSLLRPQMGTPPPNRLILLHSVGQATGSAQLQEWSRAPGPPDGESYAGSWPCAASLSCAPGLVFICTSQFARCLQFSFSDSSVQWTCRVLLARFHRRRLKVLAQRGRPGAWFREPEGSCPDWPPGPTQCW